MARRVIRTDRLIAVLGVAVLLLGGVVAWRVAGQFTPEAGAPVDRVRRQLKAYDPTLTLFDLRDGRTPGVVCGYAGVSSARRQGPAEPPMAFVSRRNRLITNHDPLKGEFRTQTDLECPDLIPNLPRVTD